jgi:UrcA family protein
VTKKSSRKTTLLLFAATASLGLMIGAPQALAQDNGPYDNNTTVSPTTGAEQVIVTAPRYNIVPGPTGGDITMVSMSGEVPIGDLDLNTAWGRDLLRDRVRSTAADVCDQLLALHTAGASGGPCYEETINGSMHRANYTVQNAYYTQDFE